MGGKAYMVKKALVDAAENSTPVVLIGPQGAGADAAEYARRLVDALAADPSLASNWGALIRWFDEAIEAGIRLGRQDAQP